MSNVTKQARLFARRQFLRGTGGFTLGLPFLPSLLPRTAHATFTQPKYFVAFATGHGGASEANMYPADALLTGASDIHPGHTAHFGKLVARTEGNDRVLSAVLRAPSSVLTEQLVGKINVLRAFDIPWYMGHNGGSHLGNFARCDQGQEVYGAALRPAMTTIDRIMAYSPNFYPNTTGIRSRGIVPGFSSNSYEHSSPAAGTGNIQNVAGEFSSHALFDLLLKGAGNNEPPPPAPRKTILDRVLASYRNLRQSNRRLSANDRQRLDDHVERLSALEMRLANNNASPSRACTNVTRSAVDSWDVVRGKDGSDPALAKQFYGLLNDVVAMAFSCGTTRIAAYAGIGQMTTYAGNWHQEVAHLHTDPPKQAVLIASMQKNFEYVMLDLAAKLDAIEYSPGKTLLDQSLLQWTQECGNVTHMSINAPIVTFGGAAGFFKTGMYVDYRNRTKTWRSNDQSWNTGITQRQWLASTMLAMGLEKSEFETPGEPGYGDPFMAADWKYANFVHPDVLTRASDVVPIIPA